MKQLHMDNGEVRDTYICHGCQRPIKDTAYRGADGEWYHADCAPEGV